MDRFVLLTEKLWRDRKFLELSTDARLLFLWSWSPPHANVCGLYKASPRDLQLALEPASNEGPETLRRVRNALRELEDRQMLVYDRPTEVVWVINRVKYAARTKASINFMQKEVARLPESPLVESFLARWGQALNITGSTRKTR